MSRKTFNKFKLEGLTGGLNTRDSADQIEDVQATSCTNFNFDGNKLINSYGLYQLYNDGSLGGINGILVDNKTIYYTKGGSLFINGVEEFAGLPDEKTYISLWDEYIFFTFASGTQEPYYWDGTTLTAKTGLGTPKYNIIYNGKWVLGGYGNDNIYFSQTGDPTTPANIIDFSTYSAGSQSVGGNSKGVITGFSIGENGLYVFKSNEAYYSNSENDTSLTFNFIFSKITANGAINQDSIEEVGQEIFYFDEVTRSVRRLSYEQNLTTLRDNSVSDEIENLLSAYERDISSATLSYSYPNLKLFLPSNLVGNETNDDCYSYNVDKKNWSVETNKGCSVASKGYLGSAYEGIIYIDDKSKGIINAPIIGERISKEFDITEFVDYKKFGGVEILGKASSGMNIVVSVIIDDEMVEERTISIDEGRLSTLGTKTLGTNTLAGDEGALSLVTIRERIDTYSSGQHIKIGISYNGIGFLEIYGFNINWRADLSYNNYY